MNDASEMAKAAAEMLREKDAEIARLRKALEFYADPNSYFAISFFHDPPCGLFIEDFDEDHGDPDFERPMPGKRARAALEGKQV